MLHRRTLCLLLGFLFPLVTAPSALGHSFAVAFVAPFTGAEADRGARWLQGFLLATRERDAHPGEESDGHLGGLDVYVLKVDTNAGAGHAGTWVNAPGDAAPDIVTGPGAGDDAFRQRFAPAPAIVTDAVLEAAASIDPQRLRTQDGRSFGAAYREVHGRIPETDATAGYLTARIIDRAVREAGDVPAELEPTSTLLREVIGDAR